MTGGSGDRSVYRTEGWLGPMNAGNRTLEERLLLFISFKVVASCPLAYLFISSDMART